MNNDDLGGLLHEEIEKLPERYRSPVVLCDLQGCSHQQAARHLGWPVGTVKSRQARGGNDSATACAAAGSAPNAALLGSYRVFTGPDPVVSPALVEATTRSVVQFVTCQTAVKVSTLSLAQGILKAMAFTRLAKVASVLVVIGVTVSAAGVAAQRPAPAAPLRAGNNAETTRADEPVTLRVTPGTLELSTVERGFVESSKNQDEYCKIEGGTTIISILPEGTRVKKGEIVCQLDSAALKDQLFNAQIVIKNAQVDYQNATAAREVAESAVTEFIEGTFKHELDSVKSEVALAFSAIRQAERRLERTRQARQRIGEVLAAKKDAVAASDILAELDVLDRVDASEGSIMREKAALELAKSKQDILEKYTRDKTIRALKLEVESKRTGEQAKQATLQLEQSRAKKLDRQIAACVITAPGDGMVIYANPRAGNASTNFHLIEEGAHVRERQKIFSLPDLTHPQVVTHVGEANVRNIRRGMRAKIRVDAFPNQLFDGTVVEAAVLPAPRSSIQDGSKPYRTKVRIDNGVPGLRPGMTAQVDFLIPGRENVLSVPAQAVLHYDGKSHVAVRKPAGAIELREVSVGVSNDKLIEITSGLETGDTVVLNPAAFITGKDENQKLAAPPQRPRNE